MQWHYIIVAFVFCAISLICDIIIGLELNRQSLFYALKPKPPTEFPHNCYTIANSNIVRRFEITEATDSELKKLSEELLIKDVNNAAKFVTVNYQEKTTRKSHADKAPLPLLTVSPEAWRIPTIQKFLPLLNNYERDTGVNENVSPMQKNEENAFMDAIMSTSVIRHLMNFLKEKGYVTTIIMDQKKFLKHLWFGMYSRSKGKASSSGFEHVFVSETKDGEVLGLHSWIYFALEEDANKINYLGYLNHKRIGDNGVLMRSQFTHRGIHKPASWMLIGTSPELEIALYTLCFVTRADNDCKLKLADNIVDIVTQSVRYLGKNVIASAFARIPPKRKQI